MQTQIESDPILLVEHSAGLLAVSAGDGVDLAVTITNRGKQRLIVDVFIDGIDNHLNRWCRCAWQRIALDSQQARTIVFRFEIPVASPAGPYQAIVVADASCRDEDALQQLLQVCPLQFDILSAPATPASLSLPLPKPWVRLLVALLGLVSITALFHLSAPRTAIDRIQPVVERVSVPRPAVKVTAMLPGAVLRVMAEAEASQASLARLPVQSRPSRRVVKPIQPGRRSARRSAARRPTRRKSMFVPQPVGRSMATVDSAATDLHPAEIPLDPLPLRPVPPTEPP